MQLGRHIKAIVKKIKKIKAARKKRDDKNKIAEAESKSLNQAEANWSCPVLESLTNEEKPAEMVARRPALAHTNTPVVVRTVPYYATAEYRLKTYRNVYLRLKELGE